MEAYPEMAQIIELLDKYFKITAKNATESEHVNSMHKDMGNLS